MADSIKFEGRLWAVVSTGASRYVGQVSEQIEDRVTLSPSYEIVTLNIPIQGPAGEVALRREIKIVPIDTALHDVRVTLYNISSISYAEDFDKADQASYVALLQDVRGSLQSNRLRQAGIEPASSIADLLRGTGGPVGRH